MKKFFICLSSLSLLIAQNSAYCAQQEPSEPYNYVADVVSITKKDDPSTSDFLKLALRTKIIKRWELLYQTKPETLNDHHMDTSRIAHLLVLIKNKKYSDKNEKKLDANRAAVLAMYHDATEVISGDMPTPIKYKTPGMKPLYNTVEDGITKDFLALLPEEFKEDFDSILNRKEEEQEQELWKIVKYADTMSAFIKCLEEKNASNNDFDTAYDRLEKAILAIDAPEVKYFIKTFLPPLGYKLPEQLSAKA